MVYASTSRPLAVLEMLVHLEPDTVPSDYLFSPIEIPDESIGEAPSLPENWNADQPGEDSQATGDRWSRSNSSLGLFVPSAVLTKEHNILINPAHPEFWRVKARNPESNFLSRRFFA